MKIVTAFFMAWGYFLALPCPYKKWDEHQRHYMLGFLPAVGIVAGALWCVWSLFLQYIGLPIYIESIATLTFIFFISGFFHLDGFMDTCDALLSRRDMAERQRILKDSTVGAFSVISVVLLIAWWIVIFVISLKRAPLWGLFLIPVISRTMSAIWVLTLKPIGHSQYRDGFTLAQRKNALIMTVFLAIAGIVIAMIIAALSGAAFYLPVVLTIGMVIASGACIVHATGQLGGMSGDISGFSLCMSEFLGILIVALLIQF